MSAAETSGYRGGNAVLDALPQADLAALLPHLAVYNEEEATVTHPRGRPIEAVNFPLGAIYSVLVEMAAGDAYEVGLIGREGVVGAELIVGSDVSLRTVLCQAEGGTARMSAADFLRAVNDSAALAAGVRASLRQQWFVSQQTVACNAAHAPAQRVARWLLMTQDAAGADTFPLRLEFMMLMVTSDEDDVRGVIRDFVKREHIRYDFERVTVRSRAALRGDVCECYDTQLLASTNGAPARSD